jgi:hypothetical protein
MSTTIKEGQSVSLDLSTSVDDPSTAKVAVRATFNNDAFVSNSVDFFLRANVEDRKISVMVSQHAYTALEGYEEPFVSTGDLISHRFTEAEARALVATLVHELAKLN